LARAIVMVGRYRGNLVGERALDERHRAGYAGILGIEGVVHLLLLEGIQIRGMRTRALRCSCRPRALQDPAWRVAAADAELSPAFGGIDELCEAPQRCTRPVT
jgi:hypothetical protein